MNYKGFEITECKQLKDCYLVKQIGLDDHEYNIKEVSTLEEAMNYVNSRIYHNGMPNCS